MAGKFTKNTIITTVTEILTFFLSIAPSIAIARVLGPEGKGIYALALLLPSFLFIFTELGISQSSVYHSAKRQHSLKEILGSAVILSFFASFAAAIIGLVIAIFFRDQVVPGVKLEYLLLALLTVPTQLFSSYTANILWGLQKINEYSAITLIKNVLFAVLIFIFLLLFHYGISGAIWAGILSGFVACIITFYWVKKIVIGVSWKMNGTYIKSATGYGIKVYLGNILGMLHSRVDMFMLNFFLNPAAVGLYSVAVGLAEQIWLISRPAGRVLFPHATSEKNQEQLKDFTPLVFRTTLLITTGAAIALYFLCPWIISLMYSDVFLNSFFSLRILLIGVVMLSAAGILMNDLYGRGMPMINTYISGISVVLNIILNLVLIPILGINGAAWATSISYSVAFLLMLLAYSRISGNTITKVVVPRGSDLHLYVQMLGLFADKFFRKQT